MCSASAAPASMISAPFGSSAPAIQVLRAVAGLDGVRNHVQRPPPAIRASGLCGRPSAMTMWVPPAVAIIPASILVRMPPRDSSEAAPPAIASMAGVMRSTTGMCRASGSLAGGAV